MEINKKMFEDTLNKAKSVAAGAAQNVDLNNIQIDIDEVIKSCLGMPVVRVNRASYLRKELIRFYPEKTVQKAIEKNPAYAGIERKKINEIAGQSINFETNKVSAISFAAGVPGGFAMAATIPADVTQYFVFILRIMQKLAYLYGFEDFKLNEETVSDDTMNQIIVFLGVMFGVQVANAGVKAIAEAASKKVSKSLAQKALTKGTIYPIVKKISQTIGIRMTKQIFADGVSKFVPVIGGAVSGGLTYFTFKPGANQLRDSFKDLYLSDPQFYMGLRKEDAFEDAQFTPVESEQE